MKRHLIRGVLTATLVFTLFSAANASVESTLFRKLNLQSPPVDVKISPGGEWIYSLTDQGSVEIYSPDGTLMDTLPVDKQVDQIEIGPRDNILLLKSRAAKTVEILLIDFIRKIDLGDSPFKGNEDAPIVLAVFSDFQ